MIMSAEIWKAHAVDDVDDSAAESRHIHLPSLKLSLSRSTTTRLF